MKLHFYKNAIRLFHTAWLFLPAAFMFQPSWAYAFTDTPTANNSFGALCPQSGGVFTARIVGCIRSALENTTEKYLTQFSTYASPMIYAALTLAVTLWGVRLLMGESQMKAKATGFMFRVAIIIWLTHDFGGMVHDVFAAMQDTQNIVTGALLKSSTSCPVGTGNDAIWQRVDCLIGRVFGFGKDNGMSAGILAIAGASVFSGSVGVQLFMTGVGGMVIVLFAIMRAVFTFLLAYTAVAFLILISPLMITMLAFNVTQRMFYAWLSQLLSAMLEPAIIFGFLSMFFLVMEPAMFKGSESFDGLTKEMASAYREGTQLFSSNVFLDTSLTDKLIPTAVRDALSSSAVDKSAGQATDLGHAAKATTIDLGLSQLPKMYALISKMTSMLILSYVMLSMLQYVPSMARSIIGMAGLSLGGAVDVPLENRTQRYLSESGKRWEKDVGREGGVTGALNMITKGLPVLVGRR